MPQNGAEPQLPQAMTRVDHLLISEIVAPNSRVIDIGCGDGALLQLLTETKNIDGRGVELSQDGVNQCVARGLSVIQGDADSDLIDYPDDAFDFAILSQTIQAVRRPKDVLAQLLRIGHYAIVSFPNFGHWRIRAQILFRGRMPVTANLPRAWHETANIHFCTIKDFVALCEELDAQIERSVALNATGQRFGFAIPLAMQNLIGEQAVFLLAQNDRSARLREGSPDPAKGVAGSGRSL